MSTTPSNSGRNMALMAAFLGWLFDGFEMGLCGFVWCERWDTYYHLFVRRLYLGSWELTFEMV